jgi:hypothetical protein
MKNNIWPNVIIPGAGRSGKMALCHYLGQISDVFIPDPAEPNYFAYVDKKIDFISKDRRFYRRIITKADDYKNIYLGGQGKPIRIDASGSYLLNAEKTIERISETIPDYKNIKIIILLRNPIERAFSAYSHYFMNSFETLTPQKALSMKTIKKRINNKWSPNYDYIAGSMYAENVSTYLNEFKNVKIILTEDLWLNTNNVFAEICTFLELSIPNDIELGLKINTSGKTKNKLIYNILHNKKSPTRILARNILKIFVSEARRETTKIALRNKNLNRPFIENDLYNKLLPIFKEDINKLETVLNLNLSSWLKMKEV